MLFGLFRYFRCSFFYNFVDSALWRELQPRCWTHLDGRRAVQLARPQVTVQLQIVHLDTRPYGQPFVGTTIFVVATSVAGVAIIVDTTRMRVYGAAGRYNGGAVIKGGLVVGCVCVIAEGVLAGGFFLEQFRRVQLNARVTGWRSGMLTAGEAFVMTISTTLMHRYMALPSMRGVCRMLTVDS